MAAAVGATSGKLLLGDEYFKAGINRMVTDEWNEDMMEDVTGAPTRDHWKVCLFFSFFSGIVGWEQVVAGRQAAAAGVILDNGWLFSVSWFWTWKK